MQPGDPERIGPYRLVRELGCGGMGRVFLARSSGGRPVALKVIRGDLAADPEFRARFRHEVNAARMVSGLYTALVVDADVDGRVPWLATAYVAGPSLADKVRLEGPLPAGAVAVLAAGLVEGLGAIHAVGLVHRDLKPSNVLLAEDGPRVIDFGISRAVEASMLTSPGLVLGSPGFMSPEQATAGEIGPPSDVFSLGAVLAFASTGRGPFGTGLAPALGYRVVHAPPDLAGVPAGIRPTIERCLAKDPLERPTIADLMAEFGDPDVPEDWLSSGLSRKIAPDAPAEITPPDPAEAHAPAPAPPWAPMLETEPGLAFEPTEGLVPVAPPADALPPESRRRPADWFAVPGGSVAVNAPDASAYRGRMPPALVPRSRQPRPLQPGSREADTVTARNQHHRLAALVAVCAILAAAGITSLLLASLMRSPGPARAAAAKTSQHSPADGATSITAAPVLVPGRTYSVDLLTAATAQLDPPGDGPQDGGVCPMWAGRWWKLNLQAGDTVTVSWSYNAPASGYYQFLVFSPSTTDSDVLDQASQGDQVQFTNSDSSPADGTFTVSSTGTYPFIIGDGCPSTSGPFQFTVTIQG